MNRIEALRREKGMSQQQLAECLGVHQTAVSQWEKERTLPGFEAVDDMCEIFDVDLHYLMGRSDERGHYRMTKAEEEDLGADLAAEEAADEVSRRKKMTKSFDILNTQGQLKALEQVQILTEVPKYRKEEK